MATDKRVKGSNVKNIIIGILLGIVGLLLYSNSIDQTTKDNFWVAAVICAIAGTIIYLIYLKKTELNIYSIASRIAEQEFANTGRKLNTLHVTVDILDAETYAFGFETSGSLITYKYDIIKNQIVARLPKKIDAVKDEVQKRDIFKNLAAKSVQRDEERRVADEEGYEILERKDEP